jgi:enoyl-CoA hydratase/carnithine racemase
MLRYEVDPPRATITIDDPERHNPLSNAAVDEMEGLVRQAAADDSVRAIVVTGAGDRAFSAGGDLRGGFVDDPIGDHDARGAIVRLVLALRGCGKPTVARVNGHALAGGFGLAAACDIVIAADDATFGLPEVKVGLWPMVITAVLQRVMPHKAALELMITGRRISAEEAQRLGVVSRVVGRDDLDDAVDLVVGGIAATSPTVMRMGKDSFYAVEDLDFTAALQHLHTALTTVASTDAAAEGVAAFLEKRHPDWPS